MVAVAFAALGFINAVVAVAATCRSRETQAASFAIDILAAGDGRLQRLEHLRNGRCREVAAGSPSNGRPTKALNFVDEFENTDGAGSGKPTRSAPSPMSPASSPRTSSASRRRCSAVSSPNLLSVDHASDFAEERKTLGFSPFRALPSPNVVVRPASEEDVRWSLSGNPIFDRSRSLPRISRHRHHLLSSADPSARFPAWPSSIPRPGCATGHDDSPERSNEALRNAAIRQKG